MCVYICVYIYIYITYPSGHIGIMKKRMETTRALETAVVRSSFLNNEPNP